MDRVRYAIKTGKAFMLGVDGIWRHERVYQRGHTKPRLYETERGATQAKRVWTSRERPEIIITPWRSNGNDS